MIDHSPALNSKSRQTNMEILRILAMFLVLSLHANFYSLGWPSTSDFLYRPFETSIQILLECVSLICVNLFIAISGWFSIKPSIKGFSKFIFQCLFFIVGSYIILVYFDIVPLDSMGLKHCVFLTPGSVWFVKAYIGLYVLAPVLNKFIETSSQRQIEKVLISFFLFQTVYSFGGAAKFIEYGLSTFTFIGIYLLSRYARLYLSQNLTIKRCILLVFIPIFLNVIVFIVSIFTEFEGARDMVTAFANPFIIISAVAAVVLFSKLKVPYIPLVNSIAASAFAVYLFHQEPFYIDKLFQSTCESIYGKYDGILYLGIITIFLTGVFLFSIILDQPRKFLWNIVSKMFNGDGIDRRIRQIRCKSTTE